MLRGPWELVHGANGGGCLDARRLRNGGGIPRRSASQTNRRINGGLSQLFLYA